MATDKRERQRANRAEKKAELAKAARRQKFLKRGRRILIWAVIILGILWLASVLGGGDGAAEALRALAL